MFLFKKKKIFKITWKYCEYPTIAPATEYIKAIDLAAAWAKICRKWSSCTLSLIDWEEIN